VVRLSRIYTRSGDRGATRLASGESVSKASPRVAAYGDVDELNAVIGLARLAVDAALDVRLGRIQNELFDLGADLATPEKAAGAPEALRIVAAQVARLEAEIDALNAELAPLNSFVLPGGTPAAAHLHHARTVCRRAERSAVALVADIAAKGSDAAHAEALRYLNRLSDLLFVMARVANAPAGAEPLWVPAATRE
jgi:cob(I)alamin adenosyltransferase